MREELLNAFSDADMSQEEALGKAGQTHSRRKDLPPDGKYDCDFADLEVFGYTDSDGDEQKAIKAQFQILTGEKEGLLMEKVFWANEYDAGALFDMTAVIAGEKPTTRPQAVELLSAFIGQKQVVCQVKRGIRKKGKRAGEPWESLDVIA